MRAIEIHELKEHTHEILSNLQISGMAYEIVVNGNIIARLVPAQRNKVTPIEVEFWVRKMDKISAEISRKWQGGSALEAIREERRDY